MNEKKPMGPLELIAALDQAMAASASIAALLANYKRELRRHGFTEEQAMDLTIEYQRIVLTQAKNQ